MWLEPSWGGRCGWCHSLAGRRGSATNSLGEGTAVAINNAGDIVGYFFVPAGEMHGALWPADGSGPQDLGALEVGDSCPGRGDQFEPSNRWS